MAAPPFLNGDPITQIETSHELSEWATNLANEMFFFLINKISLKEKRDNTSAQVVNLIARKKNKTRNKN